jgi:phosphatidate cytidylyltransferase
MSDQHDERAFDETVEAIRFLESDEPERDDDHDPVLDQPLLFAGEPGPLDTSTVTPALRFAASDDLPHWSSPPTGEIPRALVTEASSDELDAWSSFATAPAWREESRHDEFDHLADLTSEVPIATAPEPEDFFAALDEPVVEPSPAKVTSISSRQRTVPPGTGRRVAPDSPTSNPPGGEGRNLGVATVAGLAIVAVALGLFKAGPRYAMILVVAVVLGAIVEYFEALRRARYQPATLLGIVAAGALPIAAYNEGTRGMVLIIMATTMAAFVWYILVDTEARPTVNLAVTIAGVCWIGLGASFAAMLLGYQSPTGAADGIGILIGCIAATVAHDVFALAGGSVAGRSPLAPHISPNKTWEGLISGMVAAVITPVILSNWLHPWKDDWKNAAYLGVVVAVTAPFGDLIESLVKRDLGVKDMGTTVPGHGGVLDRFDGFLFTLPATWYLVQVIHLK